MSRYSRYGRYNSRQARRAWRRRDETVGFMLVDAGQSLTMLAAIAFGKWAYRHRSAFYPFVLAMALYITAGIGHKRHAGTWIPVLFITVFLATAAGIPHTILKRHGKGVRVASVLARMWSVFGIDRGIERGYLASILGFAGLWASFALANGATRKPLPAVLLFGTLILGIPWWFHRRRRSRVRVERTIQAWPTIAESVGLPGSRMVSVVVDTWGWSARLKLRRGTPSTEAIARIPHIESGLGERPGSVRMKADAAKADEVTVRVVETDPHGTPITWSGPSITSVTQAVDLGLFEDGKQVLLSVLRRNILIAGITGAGKSELLNALIGNLTACRDVVIWAIDLKGGMELKPWESCLEKIATTPEQAVNLFQDAITELNRRTAYAAFRGWRTWEPSRQCPALVIVIDEYAELPDDAHDLADSVARLGRAVAVNLVIATQRPTQKAMGRNAVRSQIDIRICLRVREPRDVDLVLWQGAYTSGWRATILDKPGVYFISTPEYTQPERARGYLVPPERVTRTATAHAGTRPVIGPYPQEPRPPERAQDGTRATQSAEPGRSGTERRDGGQQALGDADAVLWLALVQAGPDGASIGDLMAASGMARPTLYRRLKAYAQAGRAVRTAWGRWRAVNGPDGPTGAPSAPPNRPHAPHDAGSSRASRAARARRRRTYRRPAGRER